MISESNNVLFNKHTMISTADAISTSYLITTEDTADDSDIESLIEYTCFSEEVMSNEESENNVACSAYIYACVAMILAPIAMFAFIILIDWAKSKN